MEIVIQRHHAKVSDAIRRRVTQMVTKAAGRLPGTVSVVLRFEEDGPVRRVEAVLTGPRHARLAASGEARYFGPAVSQALARLGAQMSRERLAPKARARRANDKVAKR